MCWPASTRKHRPAAPGMPDLAPDAYTVRAGETRDAPTGLRNRAFLDQVLETEFARSQRFGDSMAVLMIDIDHFKQVNDRYGHQKGDQVLRRVAELVRESIRGTDIAGRYGEAGSHGRTLSAIFFE